MSNRLRLALVAGLTIGALALPTLSLAEGSTRIARQDSRRAVNIQELEAQNVELVQTQRVVRESLADAALTTVQLSEAYSLMENFARNYARAQFGGSPVIAEKSFDELFAAKVGSQLEARYALRSGDVAFLRDRAQEWVRLQVTVVEAAAAEAGE